MSPGRPSWGLAVRLATGLVLWEWVLWGLLSGGLEARAETVGRALVKDAALLLVVALGTVASLRRTRRPTLSLVGQAARLSVRFLVLLLLVAAGRGLVQRWSAPPPGPPVETGLARSVTEGPDTDEGRFLCAAATPSLDPAAPEATADVGDALRDALLLQVPLFPLALLLLAPRPRLRLGGRRGASGVALGVLGAAWLFASDAGPLGDENPCPPGRPVRQYTLAARATDLTLNAYGEHVPGGLRYALEDEAPDGAPPGPLVLRANLGECLRLRFTSRLAEGPAALHIEGLPVTVDGGARRDGFVPGLTAAPGQWLTQTLVLPEVPAAEGAYLLHDPEDGGEREARGLFGALVLEPAGTRYRDASEGRALADGAGWEALIDPPAGPSFRELVLLHHGLGPPEVADVRSARGEPLPVLDEMAGPFRPGAFGLNYRSQPHYERDLEQDEPAPRSALLTAPLLRSYRGEAVKLRVLHAGSAEVHLPHVHGGQAPPHLLSPGGGLTLQPEGLTGEVLVHCHAPNHSTGGERATWRVYEARAPHLAPLGP